MLADKRHGIKYLSSKYFMHFFWTKQNIFYELNAQIFTS